MVLPSEIISDHVVYFNNAIEFFSHYKWIYVNPNTHILVNNVLAEIPQDWIDVFSQMSEDDISRYPLELFIGTKWPLSLQHFTENCKKLRLNTPLYQCDHLPTISKELRRGTGDKKINEISLLSALINEKCKKNNIEYLVDIGSGLGYLDELLVSNYNFNIIGLECDQMKINSAINRITKQSQNYQNKLNYICTFIQSPDNFITYETIKDEIIRHDRKNEGIIDATLGINNENLANISLSIDNNTIQKADKKSLDVSAFRSSPENIINCIPCKNEIAEFTDKLETVELTMKNDILDVTDEKSFNETTSINSSNSSNINENYLDCKQNNWCNELNQISIENTHKEFKIPHKKTNSISNKQKSNPKSKKQYERLEINKVNEKSTQTEINNLKSKTNCRTPILNLEEILPQKSFCFIGLHTCGDLSIAAIKYFFSLNYARQLIYIPCCYHRLKFQQTNQTSGTNLVTGSNDTTRLNQITALYPETDINSMSQSNQTKTTDINEVTESNDTSLNQETILNQVTDANLTNLNQNNCSNEILNSNHMRYPKKMNNFDNFPLSQSLKDIYKSNTFLQVPYLRLSTQETALSWKNYSTEQRNEMVFQLLFRNVLQLYAEREKVKLIKNSRRPLKINKNLQADYITLINLSIEGYKLKCIQTGNNKNWNKLLLEQLWIGNSNKKLLIYIYLMLQNCMQAPGESLILLDRLRFLYECKVRYVELIQIFQSDISPRRYCFVINK